MTAAGFWWSVNGESVPPRLLSTASAALRLLEIVTTIPASARLALAADSCAIWYRFSIYTPLGGGMDFFVVPQATADQVDERLEVEWLEN